MDQHHRQRPADTSLNLDFGDDRLSSNSTAALAGPVAGAGGGNNQLGSKVRFSNSSTSIASASYGLKYQYFPGKNNFYFNGRFMTAPKLRYCILNFLLITVTFGLFMAFDSPYLFRNVHMSLPIVAVLFFLCVITSMIKTTCMDPGIIPRASAQEAEFLDKLYSVTTGNSTTFRPPPRTKDVVINGQTVKSKYCFTCKMFRPPRASHCGTCDNCVERFDHHCPFLGNCIGKRNYRSFYGFVMSLSCLAVIVLCGSITHLALLSRESNMLDALRDSPASAIVVLISFFGMWTVIGLAGFHTYLICVEQTTNEDIKGIFSRHNARSPYSHGGCCQNFWNILCGPTSPSAIDPRGLATPEFLQTLPHVTKSPQGTITPSASNSQSQTVCQRGVIADPRVTSPRSTPVKPSTTTVDFQPNGLSKLMASSGNGRTGRTVLNPNSSVLEPSNNISMSRITSTNQPNGQPAGGYKAGTFPGKFNPAANNPMHTSETSLSAITATGATASTPTVPKSYYSQSILENNSVDNESFAEVSHDHGLPQKILPKAGASHPNHQSFDKTLRKMSAPAGGLSQLVAHPRTAIPNDYHFYQTGAGHTLAHPPPLPHPQFKPWSSSGRGSSAGPLRVNPGHGHGHAPTARSLLFPSRPKVVTTVGMVSVNRARHSFLSDDADTMTVSSVGTIPIDFDSDIIEVVRGDGNGHSVQYVQPQTRATHASGFVKMGFGKRGAGTAAAVLSGNSRI